MTDLLLQLVYGLFLFIVLILSRPLLNELMPRQQWPNYSIKSSGQGLAIAFGLGLLYGAFSLSTVLILLHLQTPAPAPPAQDPVIAKFITCVAQPLVETLLLLGLLLLPGSIFSGLPEHGKAWILRNRKSIFVGMAAVIIGIAHPGYSLQVWKDYTPFAIFRTIESGTVFVAMAFQMAWYVTRRDFGYAVLAVWVSHGVNNSMIELVLNGIDWLMGWSS